MRFKLHAAAAVAACGLAASALAQQKDPPPRDTQQKDSQLKDGRSDRDMERSQPAPELKNLESGIGSWQLSGQCYEKSDSAPEAFSGTATSEWILGNRFVKTTVHATSGGKTVEGIAVCGYDDGKKKFVSTWQDNQCNAIKMDEGSYDPGTKTYTYTGEFTGPDGKMNKCRRTMRIAGNDEHVMTSYITEDGKPERKISEITFKRSTRSARADTAETP